MILLASYFNSFAYSAFMHLMHALLQFIKFFLYSCFAFSDTVCLIHSLLLLQALNEMQAGQAPGLSEVLLLLYIYISL